MVLCRGSSVCNFHSGAGNFDFSGVSPWNFNFVIFWKQTLAITCLGTRFPSNHPVFFSIFPLLKAYVHMLNNYHKKTSTPVFFSEPLRFSLFSFVFLSFTQLVPPQNHPPKQKIKPASKQAINPRKVWQLQQIHQQLAEVNISYHDLTEAAGRDRESPQLGSDWDPPMPPILPPIKNCQENMAVY